MNDKAQKAIEALDRLNTLAGKGVRGRDDIFAINIYGQTIRTYITSTSGQGGDVDKALDIVNKKYETATSWTDVESGVTTFMSLVELCDLAIIRQALQPHPDSAGQRGDEWLDVHEKIADKLQRDYPKHRASTYKDTAAAIYYMVQKALQPHPPQPDTAGQGGDAMNRQELYDLTNSVLAHNRLCKLSFTCGGLNSMRDVVIETILSLLELKCKALQHPPQPDKCEGLVKALERIATDECQPRACNYVRLIAEQALAKYKETT